MSFTQKDLTIFQQHRFKQLKLHRLLPQKPALHQTLFILTRRGRIDRHATTNAKRRHTTLPVDHHRANRHTEHALSSRPQQPDRTRISAAWKTLEFANDLHRAYLGR